MKDGSGGDMYSMNFISDPPLRLQGGCAEEFIRLSTCAALVSYSACDQNKCASAN